MLIGRMRLDSQRMDAGGHQQAQSIIHEAMSRHAAAAGEPCTGDAHAEVPALAGTGMAGMQVAFVDDFEQRGGKAGLDAGCNLIRAGPRRGTGRGIET